MIGLKISGNFQLSTVQAEFKKAFAFLKIEFFKNSHENHEPSSRKEMIKGNPLVSTLLETEVEGYIDLDPKMTVADLEKMFFEKFGLNVQVFRKSGMVWLETSVTDNMTLKGQNELGMEKSKPLEKTDVTDVDYD